MTRSSTSPAFRRPTRSSALSLIAAVGLACAAGSCDRADSAQQTIDAANMSMESLSTSGSNPAASVKFRKDALTNIATKLKPVAEGNESSQSQAASMIVARAKAGLGQLSARDASETEQGFLSQITITRAQLDQWVSQHSTASALLSYDPAKDLADLDTQAAAKFAEAGTEQAKKAKQEQVVAEIRARSEQSRAAAKTERDREAGIRKQAEGLSQTERESYIVRAAEASRAADALERTAAELSADASKEAPKVDEIANTVDRLQKQVDSLKRAKDAIQARSAAAKKNSAVATTEANAVGSKIKASLDTLAQKREAAGSPTQEALKQYAGAVQSAKKGTTSSARDVKTASSAALGGYQQCIGDIYATRARSLALYAGALGAIAQATPAVPGASEIAAKAKSVVGELEATTKDGEAAYEEAMAGYEKAIGSAGDAKAKLEQVKKALQELKDLRTHTVKAPEPAPEKPTDAPMDAKPAADAGKPEAAKPMLAEADAKAVEAEVRAMVREVAAAGAAGNMDKVVAHIVTKTDADKAFLLAAIPLGRAAKSLDAACIAKWGKDLAGLAAASQVPSVKGNPMLGMLATMLGKGNGVSTMSGQDVDALAIKALSATEAEVSTTDAPTATKVVKTDEGWKISLPAGSLGNPMAAQMMPMFKGLTDAFTKAATGTTEGKYATADDMLTELSAQLMGAMGGMMGGPGGAKPKPPGGDTKPPAPKGGG